MDRQVRRTATWFILVSLLLGAAPSFSDFSDGLAAYDAGDYAAALEAWLPLAEAGDVEAQLSVAGLYGEGLGVGADASRAAHWYRKAAEQGDPVAQLNLGDLYYRAEGVERDLAQAYFWLTLSARQGRSWPLARREQVERFMTKAERAEAERLLATWEAAR